MEEMLRDRIVVSLRDPALSEHLHMDAKLTLDKVKRNLLRRPYNSYSISYKWRRAVVPKHWKLYLSTARMAKGRREGRGKSTQGQTTNLTGADLTLKRALVSNLSVLGVGSLVTPLEPNV